MNADTLELELKKTTQDIAVALDTAGVKGSILSATAMHHLALGVLLSTIGPEKTREMLVLSIQTIDEVYGPEQQLASILGKMKTRAVH